MISHFIMEAHDELITAENFLPFSLESPTYKATLIAVKNHLDPWGWPSSLVFPWSARLGYAQTSPAEHRDNLNLRSRFPKTRSPDFAVVTHQLSWQRVCTLRTVRNTRPESIRISILRRNRLETGFQSAWTTKMSSCSKFKNVIFVCNFRTG
jgi:hypothetical protein